MYGHVHRMSMAPNLTETNSSPESNYAPELIDMWAAALLSRDSVGVEDIVQRARRMHTSSGLIGD